MLVALVAEILRQFQHDRDRQHIVLASQRDQRLARLLLHIRRVDDRQLSGSEALGGNEVQDLKRVGARRLIVLVIRNQAAAKVRGEDFRRFEVPAREGRFAGTGGADENNEAEVGDGEHRHRADPGYSTCCSHRMRLS